jgi:hypothetical protein
MVIAGSGVEIAPTPTTTEASRAMAELNEADEPFFKRAEAVLRRHYPAQADFLFDNLAPVHGPDAFLGMAILLGRIDALESAPEREGSRAEDSAALAKLEARGITKAVRTHDAALVRHPPASEPSTKHTDALVSPFASVP